MNQLVTPQGIAAQAEFDELVTAARPALHTLLGGGYLGIGPMFDRMAESGFSVPVAREAMWQLLYLNIVNLRVDRTLALTEPRDPQPAPEPGPPDHAAAIAAAIAFELDQGIKAPKDRPADYWSRLMNAVAPAFADEAGERARQALAAAGSQIH